MTEPKRALSPQEIELIAKAVCDDIERRAEASGDEWRYTPTVEKRPEASPTADMVKQARAAGVKVLEVADD